MVSVAAYGWGARNAPSLERPRITDLQFETKSGKTPEGWPIEQVKAGGLAGLCAYACFYATRKLRPGLVAEPTSLGIDANFTQIFWTFWPGFSTAEQMCQQFMDRARKAVEAGDACTIVSVCDALAEGVDPQHSFTSYLRPAQQAQLIAASRSVILLGEFLIHGSSEQSIVPGSPVLSLAVENLRTRVSECITYLEFSGSQAGASAGATSAPLLVSVPPPVLVRSSVSSVSSSLWSAATPRDIAAQWTHTEAHLFRSIPMAEWIAAGWDKPRYEHAADCTRRFIDKFNATALWVTAEVLAQPSPEERAVIILHFIQVGSLLLRYNNFCGAAEISMGLRREACARLKSTWALVPPIAKEKLAAILELADDKRNYANYKAALRALSPEAPMVPHLGAHTSELSVQEQLLQPHIPAPGGGEHIHFRRWRELFFIVDKLSKMQERLYGDSLPPFSPITCNFLSGTIRPFFFSFDEDREAAVARLDTRSRQAESDPPDPTV